MMGPNDKVSVSAVSDQAGPASNVLNTSSDSESRGLVSITAPQQMLASCSGAMLTSLFVTPLDVVKIRLQAQQKPFTTGTCFVYHNGLMDTLCLCNQCVNGANGATGTGAANGAVCSLNQEQAKPWYQKTGSLKFNGTVDAFVKISRSEGLASLWSGLPPTLVMAIPATVVYFTSYDRLKYAMGYKEGDPSTRFIPVLAGSSARVFAATIISPLELIRTKMQSELLTYRDIGRAVYSTVSQEGPLSLMRGLGPTLLRDVPFSAIYWFGYESLKAKQMSRSGSQVPKYHECLLAGAVAGTVAGVVTLPFDVVKTHRQVELGEAALAHKKHDVTSTWKIIMRIYRQNGIPGLFAGIVPRLAKVTPACAIMISTYEYAKLFFHRRNAHQQMVVSAR